MNKLYFQLIIMIFSVLLASASFAAELRWGAVENTATCTIAGYNIYYGTDSENLNQVEDAGNNTSYNLDQLTLLPAKTTFYFAVSAYSTDNEEGPLSSPVPFMDSPNIVGNPSVNHTNDTIEITFNENDMQNASTKTNYDFSPTVQFNTNSILRINKTYRLYMDYIPEHTIITMTLSNITDNKGLGLISNSVTINDDDNDNIADDWEADYGIDSPFLDADDDGLSNIQEYTAGTSPNLADSDEDGMDDNWEVQNGLNPLVDDANEDADNDGISNFDEYNGVTSTSNSGPNKPILSLPANSSTNIGLTPELKTNAYVDSENNAHAKTQWQISTGSNFEETEYFVFEIESYENLTELTVPEFILNPNQTYYWRVKFFDIPGGSSAWSNPFTLTTVATNTEDPDEDGVPNIQQVTDGVIDLNNDGTLDVSSNTYKMVNYESKSLSMEASNNVAAIDCLKTINPDEITDSVGKPANLPVGLLQFKISVNNYGDTAEIKIYFSESVGNQWYKYDLTNGWTEYSADYPANVQFGLDGKSVTLRLVDGGAGDSDGVANGIIVDPSGPGLFAAAAPSGGAPAGDSGGGGCFIATTAFDSSIKSPVQILKDITKFVHASPFVQSIIIFLIIGMAAIVITRIRQNLIKGKRPQNFWAA